MVNSIFTGRSPKSFDDNNSLREAVVKYDYAIIYRIDGVQVVKAANAAIDVDDNDKVLEVRAFNENEELRVVKIGSKYIGRIRTDGEGKLCNVIVEDHLLWGNSVEKKDEKIYLRESRGTEIVLEFDDIHGINNINETKRLFLTVYCYENDVSDDFGYDDFRFVKFSVKEVSEYGEK